MTILLQAFAGLSVIYFQTIHFQAIIIYFQRLKYLTQKSFDHLTHAMNNSNVRRRECATDT